MDLNRKRFGNSSNVRTNGNISTTKTMHELFQNSSITDTPIEIPVVAKDCLKGMTFTIDGNLNRMTREEAIAYIEVNGGRYLKICAQSCQYLIIGSNHNQNECLRKIKNAWNANKSVLTENQFFDLVRNQTISIKKEVLNTCGEDIDDNNNWDEITCIDVIQSEDNSYNDSIEENNY